MYKRILTMCFLLILAATLLSGCTPRYDGVWVHAVAPGMWEVLTLNPDRTFVWNHCYGETDRGTYKRDGDGIFLTPYGERGGWHFEELGDDAFMMGGDVYLKQ